jgi:DNA repair exonuclease SbcCD ATPase subunit
MAAPPPPNHPHLAQLLVDVAGQLELIAHMPQAPVVGIDALIANLTQHHNEALEQRAQHHTAALAQRQQQHLAALAQRRQQHLAALTRRRQQHLVALTQRRQQHLATLAQHEEQHQELIERLDTLQERYVLFLPLL